MQTFHTIAALRQALTKARAAGLRIALVPTMGNLHQGHLALVEEARRRADLVVASIFVNPIQFGPSEDFARYPRTLDDDRAQLESTGCDVLFAPDVDTLYPNGLDGLTQVRVPKVSQGLCAATRPGHFDGVATVVSLLFHIVGPDVALFGNKDYQQLAVIRKLVADLHFPIEIIGVPTVRDADGLALSSRNGYLDREQRERAPLLARSLRSIAERLAQGIPAAQALAQGRDTLEAQGFVIDYLELRAPDLAPLDGNARQAILLAAAYLGTTRLLDNLAVTLPD